MRATDAVWLSGRRDKGAGRFEVSFALEKNNRPKLDVAVRIPGATETIYRGDTCNCQARVRKDKAGRTVGLVFRSAC